MAYHLPSASFAPLLGWVWRSRDERHQVLPPWDTEVLGPHVWMGEAGVCVCVCVCARRQVCRECGCHCVLALTVSDEST